MTSNADQRRGEPAGVEFGNGQRATLVEDTGLAPDDLLSRLGLPAGAEGARAILVCGGAAELTGAALGRAEAVLGDAVATAAQVTGAAVLDGGTSAGVMAITGAARGRRPDAIGVHIGVAPAGQIFYPGAEARGDGAPLEENHTHFVLAEAGQWGGESGLLIGLTAGYAAHGRVVVVLAGGGGIATSEIVESVRHGWPVYVIGGTGGIADEILGHWQACRVPRRRAAGRLLPPRYRCRPPRPLSSISGPALREIVADGDIRPFTGSEPGQLARQIAWELQDERLLKDAWQQFATYDQLAGRLRTAFTRFQVAILSLGVLSTLLALVQARVPSAVLHWVVVTIPILVAVLVAVAGRRTFGQRWVVIRAAAEAIKAEIYRYRTLIGGHRVVSDADRVKYRRHLAAQLNHIQDRLMHTDASSGPLTPYHGPLPPEMYGAGRDDDGLSPLDARRYLDIRVDDQLGYFYGRIRRLSARRNVLQFVSIAAGASGAILAAAGFYVWIGLTGGVAAALLAYLNSLQVDNTIVTYNQSAAKLAGIKRDWQVLGPAEPDAAEFDKMVSSSETVLTGELTGWVEQMSQTVAEIRHQQAGAAGQERPATAPEQHQERPAGSPHGH